MKFTEDHEWVKLQGQEATIGITEYAVEQLGDIVFVELPEIGAVFDSADDAAVVESVKAASDIYSPISGTVTAVNSAIVENPALVNEDPEGVGWFFKLEVTDASEFEKLLDEDDYRNQTA
ncbi:MAG: glycine cleavage system protein GcvH [Rhodobacteraceae bacterium]|nr:glycine cleavage system protein GcvH [Paracoccaceae bacterium]